MKLLTVPVGIAALLMVLAVGLAAGLWGRGYPATDRALTQAVSPMAVPTPRSDSLRRAANATPTARSDSLRREGDTTNFMQRFVGVVDFARSDDSVSHQVTAYAADAPTSPRPAVPTRGIVPTHIAAVSAPTTAPARAVTHTMQLASLEPTPQDSPSQRALAQPSPPVVDRDAHAAVYDISAHTVYLPDGRKLEAHSGIGHRIDNPRYVEEKNRGPTPPNVYELSLREHIFHGVRALRLTPIGDGRMYGRDGILAHSYMLGPNGQSNGCVAVRNYPALLQAFMSGEVQRLIVVDHLKTSNPRVASLQ
ncbi:MAG TPA: DUF2778 domain-containing protein [Xanthobacteraceae bacterium]|nr:DUF2778 domain-containing protein [Xanthobacteraceae bacterium]